MSKEIEQALMELRRFMFEKVYENPIAKGEETKAKAMLKQLFYFYKDHIDYMPEKFIQMLEEGEKEERVVCDYIAGMTDKYAVDKYTELFIPMGWIVRG